MPLDLPSSGRRPAAPSVSVGAGASVTSLAEYAQQPWTAPPASAPASVAVVIVSADPALEATLRAQLSAAAGLHVVEDPALAGVIVWVAPIQRSGELPLLPIDPAHDDELEAPPVVAIISETTDPMPLLAAGVRGLLDVNVDIGRLRATILATQLGLSVLDEDPADAIVAAWSPPDRPPANERLTPREQDVLERVAEGLSNRAIGEALGISAHTVKFHVDALLDKLTARSRTHVVVKAVREGLLRL
ncbi:response regulator transcription factor [Enhygromyxa salina]|uniref:Transcriptional regulatory protein DegU n=1 Tax=Enhygromyxa salina TaxID=215803 RepID=A0A2S9XC09_9BACT|nr:response regulator transcription factor [Enhygromyxa salina]PRP90394.1 Transcriptional regulatory protein DegU [Enhygromyxa salina]